MGQLVPGRLPRYAGLGDNGAGCRSEFRGGTFVSLPIIVGAGVRESIKLYQFASGVPRRIELISLISVNDLARG